jgi:hypothetical protein
MNNSKYMKTATKTYRKLTPSPFFLLRDEAHKENVADMLEPTTQVRYFNDITARFLKTFVKLYAREELSDSDREKLHRYLDKVIEAKDAVSPREPKGGMYLKKF